MPKLIHQPLTSKACQACEDSYQNQCIALHDAHGARLQAHHMLQVKAKRQHGHTGDADQRQDAPARFQTIEASISFCEISDHASTKDNAL
jgi:hypothetical protein